MRPRGLEPPPGKKPDKALNLVRRVIRSSIRSICRNLSADADDSDAYGEAFVITAVITPRCMTMRSARLWPPRPGPAPPRGRYGRDTRVTRARRGAIDTLDRRRRRGRVLDDVVDPMGAGSPSSSTSRSFSKRRSPALSVSCLQRMRRGSRRRALQRRADERGRDHHDVVLGGWLKTRRQRLDRTRCSLEPVDRATSPRSTLG
jgi:hypothetical protein